MTRICFCFSMLICFFIDAVCQHGSSCPEDLFPKYSPGRLWGYANVLGQWSIQPIYTKVSPFVESKAIVMKGSLQGAIDCDGNPIIPIQYELLTNFNFGRTWAKQKGLWSLLNERGKVLMPAQFDEISPIQNTQLSWLSKGGLWGLFNEESGSFLCKPQYTKVQIMSENASLVEVGDLYGVINHVNCKFLVPPQISKVKKVAPHMIVYKQGAYWGLFNELGAVRLNPEFDTLYLKINNVLAGQKNGLYGLYDLTGKELLAPEFDLIGEFSEGYFLLKQNGKYGYGTRFGKIFIPVIYNDAHAFKNKMAVVKKNNLYGIIDIRNRFVLPAEYSFIDRNTSQGFLVTKKPAVPNSTVPKFNLLNTQLKTIIPQMFDTVFTQDSSRFVRVVAEGKFKFLNIGTGKLDIGSGYENAFPFSPHHAIIQANSKWGVVDTSGKIMIQTIYDSIGQVRWGDRKLYKVHLSTKIGMIEPTGRTVVEPRYELVNFVPPNYLKLKKDGRYGVRKSTGEEVASQVYDYLSNDQEEPAFPTWPAKVRKGNTYGLLNERGAEIISPQYDSIVYLNEGMYGLFKGKRASISDKSGTLSKIQMEEVNPFQHGMATFKKGKKYGYVATNLEQALPVTYDEAYPFIGKAAVVKKEGMYQVIDKKGKPVSSVQFDKVEVKGGEYHLVKGHTRYTLDPAGKVKQVP